MRRSHRINTEDRLRQDLNQQTDTYYHNQPKSPLSPWLKNKHSNKQIKTIRKHRNINTQQSSERGIQFLKKIKRKKNYLFKPLIKNKAQEYGSVDKVYESTGQQSIKNQDQQNNHQTLMMFPFTNIKDIHQASYTQRANFHIFVPRNRNKFISNRHKQIQPVNFQIKINNYKTQKSQEQFHTPQKSKAVSTIYGRKFRNRYANILDKKNNTLDNQNSPTSNKKLSLHQVSKLISSTTNQVNDLKKKTKGNQYHKKNKTYIEKKYSGKKYSHQYTYIRKSGIQFRSQKNFDTPHLTTLRPSDTVTDGWLAPRSHFRTNNIKSSQNACKTIYI